MPQSSAGRKTHWSYQPTSRIANRQDNCRGLRTCRVVAGKEIIRTGGIVTLMLLGCGKLARANTIEILPPLVDCPCGRISLAAVACGETPIGREPGAEIGMFELLPAEVDFSSPLEPSPAGEYLEPGLALQPRQASGTTAPALRLAVALLAVSGLGGPITITICLAGLALKSTGNSGTWPEKRRRGSRQKKSRATPDRRRAA
jgi:hypothetical protein